MRFYTFVLDGWRFVSIKIIPISKRRYVRSLSIRKTIHYLHKYSSFYGIVSTLGRTPRSICFFLKPLFVKKQKPFEEKIAKTFQLLTKTYFNPPTCFKTSF
ncbi:hypothetical protein LEP1GSC071_4116 [Leptospira santarosai str. JET]|nr:hypothetical protein LEP1GSC071_4116 [Leptospira santarosai str. JET]